MVDYPTLLDRARRHMADGKGRLACSVVGACLSPAAAMPPKATAIAYDVLRFLIGQVAPDVRRRIAEALAPRTDGAPET